MGRARWKLLLGSALLLLLPLVLAGLLFADSVRRPLGRTVATLTVDWLGEGDGVLRFDLDDVGGLSPGHPVFLADRPGSLEPVAWVRAIHGTTVDVQPAPGATLPGDAQLVSLSVPSGLIDLWNLALPDAAAEGLEARLTERLNRLLREAVFPELEARLPDFLARVDPRQDAKAREVLDTVGAGILERVRPLADELADRIIKDLDARFDLLDRVGLLWKVVRGDGEGLGRKLLPVAEESAAKWWAERSDAVLAAVGEGVAATAPTWRTWLGTDVMQAALDELADPVLAAHRARLEREAEAAMGDVLRTIVNAPEGGFRVRFAAILRNRLLEKDEPLLLLRRPQ